MANTALCGGSPNVCATWSGGSAGSASCGYQTVGGNNTASNRPVLLLPQYNSIIAWQGESWPPAVGDYVNQFRDAGIIPPAYSPPPINTGYNLGAPFTCGVNWTPVGSPNPSNPLSLLAMLGSMAITAPFPGAPQGFCNSIDSDDPYFPTWVSMTGCDFDQVPGRFNLSCAGYSAFNGDSYRTGTVTECDNDDPNNPGLLQLLTGPTAQIVFNGSTMTRDEFFYYFTWPCGDYAASQQLALVSATNQYCPQINLSTATKYGHTQVPLVGPQFTGFSYNWVSVTNLGEGAYTLESLQCCALNAGGSTTNDVVIASFSSPANAQCPFYEANCFASPLCADILEDACSKPWNNAASQSVVDGICLQWRLYANSVSDKPNAATSSLFTGSMNWSADLAYGSLVSGCGSGFGDEALCAGLTFLDQLVFPRVVVGEPTKISQLTVSVPVTNTSLQTLSLSLTSDVSPLPPTSPAILVLAPGASSAFTFSLGLTTQVYSVTTANQYTLTYQENYSTNTVTGPLCPVETASTPFVPSLDTCPLPDLCQPGDLNITPTASGSPGVTVLTTSNGAVWCSVTGPSTLSLPYYIGASLSFMQIGDYQYDCDTAWAGYSLSTFPDCCFCFDDVGGCVESNYNTCIGGAQVSNGYYAYPYCTNQTATTRSQLVSGSPVAYCVQGTFGTSSCSPATANCINPIGLGGTHSSGNPWQYFNNAEQGGDFQGPPGAICEPMVVASVSVFGQRVCQTTVTSLQNIYIVESNLGKPGPNANRGTASQDYPVLGGWVAALVPNANSGSLPQFTATAFPFSGTV